MKKGLAIIVFLLGITAFGQTVIVNRADERHQTIAGSKISMVPPAGFVESSGFSGFRQSESGATIMVVGMPGVSYQKLTAGMTKEGLAAQGIELVKLENLTINNFPAVLVTAKQDVLGDLYAKYMLCLGTDGESVMISAVYPMNEKVLDQELRTALLSTIYDPTQKVVESQAVDFDLDTSKSKFVLAKSMSNQLLFTKDGKVPTEAEDRTIFIAGKTIWNTTIADRKKFCVDRLEELPISIVSEDEVKEIVVDGLNGYELYATSQNKLTGFQEKVYLVILFSDTAYYTFFGTTAGDFEENLTGFKNFVLTFKKR